MLKWCVLCVGEERVVFIARVTKMKRTTHHVQEKEKRERGNNK